MSLDFRQDDAEVEPQDDSVSRALPAPLYTFVLIGAFVAVALVQFGTGLERSVTLAGFVKPAFTEGDYWRILTGAALHGGILHLFLNSYAFYSFGRIAEMLAARAHVAIVFLAAAIGGGVLSYVLSPGGTSVGASGGIVGLIGYLAVYAFKRKDFITSDFRGSLLMNIAFILIYGIAMWQTVDNFAHIGGLITGAAYAFMTVSTDPYGDSRQASSMVQVLGLMCVGVYLAVCAFCVLLMLDVV